MIFPGTKGRLTGQWFPGSSFVPFLNMGAMFPFFQSPGTLPDCHDLLNAMESGLATTSASSSGLWDASPQVPHTSVLSGSPGGDEPDFPLQ